MGAKTALFDYICLKKDRESSTLTGKFQFKAGNIGDFRTIKPVPVKISAFVFSIKRC
jgi:hypothetical protein